MPKQCLFYWNNLPSEGSGQFTLQAGASPSRGTFRFRLGANIPKFGTLFISDGYQRLPVTGCRVVRASITPGSAGRWQEITVEDSRWRWQEIRCWGEYNTLKGTSIVARTKRSARTMASRLLDILGVPRYSVQAIPDDSYPQVAWDADYAAQALEQLCSQYGCVIVPKHSGMIVIEQVGVGRRPPIDSRAMDASPSREPQVVPDTLVFEGGPISFQQDLPLEPVGKETDSAYSVWKPIDELSYKPTTGWEGEHPEFFYGVHESKREFARSQIWRHYRVGGNAFHITPITDAAAAQVQAGQTPITTHGSLIFDNDGLWKILPLSTKQNALAKAVLAEEPPDAQVLGYFKDRQFQTQNNVEPTPDWFAIEEKHFAEVPDPKLVYRGGFSLDADEGIVSFSEPMYRLRIVADIQTGCVKADIRLRTSFGLRNFIYGHYLCAQYILPLPGGDKTGLVEVVKRPELVLNARSVGNAPRVSTSDQADYVAQARVYLQEALAKYYPDDAISVPYKGFVMDIEVDGAVRAVTWSRSEGGEGTSSVDYQTDRPDLRMSPKEIRARANIQWQLAKAPQLQVQATLLQKPVKKVAVQ